jgi:hypothetical protein
MEIVGAGREGQVESQKVVREVRRALVPGSRERRDARVGEVVRHRVGERRFGLAHQADDQFGSTASIPGTASDYGG